MDRNSRLPSLTGLRWAAALIVFGQHLLEQYYNPQLVAARPVRSAVWAVLAHGGGLGVSFFFVLSGFVLAWSARPGERAGTFWWRRFSKVYPATLVTTLVAAVVVGGAGPLQLATHLTLTQSWVPRHDVYAALNLVGWSLSCEAFFYLCFPLLLAGLRRLGPAGLWAIAVMMVECVAALSVNLVSTSHATAAWVGYILPPVRMAEFTLGVAVALLVRTGAWRGPGLRWSLALLPPASAAGLFAPYPVNEHAVTLVPVALIVAAAARADLRGIPTLWSRPLMVYLGELSFAFYLVHFLVLAAFDRHGLLPHQAGPVQALAATGSVLWFSLLAAMLVYHGVELPALRLLRRDHRVTAVPTGRGRHRMVLTAAPAPRFVGTAPMPRPALSAPSRTVAAPPPAVPAPSYAPPAPAPSYAPPAPAPSYAVPAPSHVVAAPRHAAPVQRPPVSPPPDAVAGPRHADSGLSHGVPPSYYGVPPSRHGVPGPHHAAPVQRPPVSAPPDAVAAPRHADSKPGQSVSALPDGVVGPRHADSGPGPSVSAPRHAAAESRSVAQVPRPAPGAHRRWTPDDAPAVP